MMDNDLAEGLSALMPQVDAQFDENDDLGNLIKAYNGKKTEKKRLEDEASNLGKEMETLNQQIVKMMDARGLTNIKYTGVGTVYQRTSHYTSVKNRAGLIDWLDSRGEGHLAERNVHPATLKSWYNERMERGEEVPPSEIVTAYSETKIAIRKG